MLSCVKSLVLLGVGGSLLISGCSLAPTHVTPQAPVPGSYGQEVDSKAVNGATVSQLEWQEFIQDPTLRRVIEVALEENRDLRQALLNVQAARSQYRIEDSDRLPNVNLGLTAGRQRVSGDTSGTGSAETSATYQSNLGLSAFELDFWGRVKNLSESALQEYLATEAAANTARITLISEVTQAYLRRVGAQEQYDLTRKTLATRATGLALMAQRREFGNASDLDYQESLSLTEQARADLNSMERELAQADNALTLLVGRKLNVFTGQENQAVLLEEIRAGLPSELLLRRPDIQSAEHKLRARNAEIGAARAAFFPRISLTGLGGASSSDLSNLFNSSALTWQFLPQLSLPIFDNDRNQASLELAQVRKEMAVAEYEKAIQTAFREVADALASRDTLKEEESSRSALAASSARSLELARLRYEQGVDSHLRYLDAQRTDFANQITLIQTRTQRQIALIQLFRALGGGWNTTRI
ncbi:MAG: efflux transporter outer membrane subunit [Desulfobacterales bacterium]|nr:efflux transporter outer membrane subunit [Desulfobacterales bacterium]